MTLTSILTSPLFAPIIATIVTGIVTAAGTAIYKAIMNSNMSDDEKALAAAVVTTAGQVLEAEKVATGGKMPGANDLPRLGQTALTVLKAQAPTLVQDAEDVALTQIHHQLALQTGQHALVTPTGLSLNAPALVKVGAFLLLPLLLCSSAAAHAQATGAAPTVPAASAMKAYTLSLLEPGIKFPFGGNSPVELAGGAGVQLSYNLFPVTVPVLGQVPALSVGGALLGNVAGPITGAASVSYGVSIGPLVTFLHALSIAIVCDLAANGSVGWTGALTGRVSNSNFAGLLMFDTQALIDAWTAASAP